MNRRYSLKVLAATVTMLAIVVNAGPAVAEPIALRISHAFGTRTEFIEKMQTRFNESHDNIRIEYVVGGDNWGPLLQSTLRDSIVNQLPDVSHQAINYTRVLSQRGIAQPLDGIPGGSEFLKSAGISAPLLKAATVEGHTYAVPYGLTVPVVFYNMSLLKKAGWELDRAPATWEEINDAAAKVATLGGANNGGYIEYEASNNWMYQSVLNGIGGSMEAADGSVGFDNDLGVEALSIIASFADAADTVTMTRDQARQAFNAGTMGILFRSASGIPSVAKAADTNGFELAVGAFPVSENGSISANSHGVFIYTKEPSRQKAALEYLIWAYGPEAQAIEAEFAGYIPANLKALNESPLFDGYFKANPYNRNLVGALADAGDWYTYPVDNAEQIFDAQIEVVRRVIAGGITPSAAAVEMVAATKDLLN